MTKILHPTSTPDAAVSKSPRARLGKEVKPELTGPHRRWGGGSYSRGSPTRGWARVRDDARFAIITPMRSPVSSQRPALR